MKRVVVTGGAGQIAYSLLFRIASGELFGPREPVFLCIRDLEEMIPTLEGVAMELEDCAFPLLAGIEIGSNPRRLFENVDVAFLVGAKPRGPGMERSDLLMENAKIFVDEGKALNDVASLHVKVLVVGNPCNTNCLIAMSHAPRLSKRNFHAMLRLDENRARSILAKRAGVAVSEVTRLTVWGNHSTTQVPDFSHALIRGMPAAAFLNDPTYLYEEYLGLVQKRGGAVIAARGKSSAASAANAALDAMRSLLQQTPEGGLFTSGVISDGNPYGIEENLVFGFPLRLSTNGEWSIVPNLSWDPFFREKIVATQKELLQERECVKHLLGS